MLNFLHIGFHNCDICPSTAGGKQTAVDIMGMMDCFIMGQERVRLLAQPLLLMILLVVVLTMLQKNFFSRKAVMYFILLHSLIMYLCLFHVQSYFTLLLSISSEDLIMTLYVASKNGAVVGAVHKDIKGPLFPTIAVHSQNEEYVTLPF